MTQQDRQGDRRLVWHYTTINDLLISVAGGAIPLEDRRSTPGLDCKPAVWFSSHPEWEPTASKTAVVPPEQAGNRKVIGPSFGGRVVVSEGRAGTERLGGGLARIGVLPEVAPHGWGVYRQLCGGDPKLLQKRQQDARVRGAEPLNWRTTFDPVPVVLWEVVEIMEQGCWLAVPLDPRNGHVVLPAEVLARHEKAAGIRR